MSVVRESSHLYDRLPAIYRELDAGQGSPLRALLEVVQRQAQIVEDDVEQLWDDFFIETCRSWVVPYIGDLVANDLLYDAGRIPESQTASELFDDLASADLRPAVAVPVRADVARTIGHRRRKGTVPMLEELARDVTGWSTRVVELYALLGRTQHVDYVRTGGGWADLGSPERCDRVDGPWDDLAHTVAVARPNRRVPRFGPLDIAFFLWRLRGYPLEHVPARQADRAWRYHFSPLGNPAPLFTPQRRDGEGARAQERHVPAPIRPALFHADLEAGGELYGPFASTEASIEVTVNGTPVPPGQVACRRLDPWPSARAPGRVVGIDVAAGRLAVGSAFGTVTGVDVSFHQGFPGELGGGPYDRRRWLVRRAPGMTVLHVEEGIADDPVAGRFGSVAAALAHWASAPVGRPNAVVSIADSRSYVLPASIELLNERRLVIEAADGERPVLRTDDSADDSFEIQVDVPAGAPDRASELTLSGVVLEGWLHVIGDLGRLRLLHSTVIPGRRLRADGTAESDDVAVHALGRDGSVRINEQLRIEAGYAITGPFIVPEHAAGVWLLDSIVDGLGGAAFRGPLRAGVERPGSPLTVERSTLLGRVLVRSIDAADSIFTDTVTCDRTQTGGIRTSFLPSGSRTPRRLRCQPDAAVAAAQRERERHTPAPTPAETAAIRAEIESWLVSSFTSRRYGSPAYAQLREGCPVEVTTGAEDGSELGAFSHLKQPQRESNIRIRLGEYLPFGLDPSIVHVT
jgi:hypothetical protein